jgi:hypothetical protein
MPAIPSAEATIIGDGYGEEEDAEAAVRNCVTLLTHHVALRLAVDESVDLLRELEEYQAQCWARDEQTFHKACPLRPKAPVPAASEGTSRSAARTSNGAEARLRRTSPVVHTHAPGFESVAISHGSSASSAQRRPGSAAPRPGSAAPPSLAPPPADIWPGAAQTSYVEMLLPVSPPSSQFVCEFANPLQAHADSMHDRLLQRKLSVLGQAQAETVRQEKRARRGLT